MGKSTKRRSKGRGNHHKNKSYQPKDAVGDTTDGKSSKQPTPVLLQRLRHADATTRHATLTALLHSKFSLTNDTDTTDTAAQPQQPQTKKKAIPTELLQAIRDQVALEQSNACSIVAAACLSNYLQQQQQFSGELSSCSSDITASWMVVFLQRIRRCYLQQPQEPSSAAATMANNNDEEPVRQAVVEGCLQSLVHLLEGNPLAIDRWMKNPVECMDVLTTVLLSSSKTTTSSTTTSMVVVLAHRCLHSTWDDNSDLVIPFLQQQQHSQKALQTLELLRQTMRRCVSTDALSQVAALHAAATWMAAWRMTIMLMNDHNNQENDNNFTKNATTVLLTNHVGLCLQQCRNVLVWSSPSTLLQLSVELLSSYKKYGQQKEDHALECTVVSQVDRKKEPARLIARRLKNAKQDNTAASMTTDDVTMTDDSNANAVKPGKLPEDRRDRAAAWHNEFDQWVDATRPLQLAFEILTNLTSGTKNMDDDNEMTDADESVTVPLGAELSKHLMDSQIPSQVLFVYRSLLSKERDDTRLPPPCRVVVSDLQQKACACMGNLLLANLLLPDDVCHWSDFQRAKAVDTQAQEALVSLQVVALGRPQLRSQIGEADLTSILDLLQSSSSSNSNATNPMISRDCVCMLGLLSAEPHDATVNERVCRSLLAAAKSSSNAMATSEVLSVLMDMYGDDAVHPDVFERCQVLPSFQMLQPVLKQQIVAAQLTANEQDVEQWQETCMNAARFVQYKKGHLE